MWLNIAKIVISGLVIFAVTEVNKRSTYLSALLISLPLTSLLAMTWMHLEGQESKAIAEHATGTFWFVLPTLPMFLILPRMLEAKWNFYFSLIACCLITSGLYFIMDRILRKFEIL